MYVVVVLALVLWPHAQALAARTLPADKPIAVRLEASQPTAVALPEPVASVAAVASEHFSADYDGPYLFLLSVDPTLKGRVFVVGQSGTLYTVFFAVATPADDVVHLTATLPQPAVKAPPLTPSTVLRALRTGTALPGQAPSDLRLPPFPDARVVLSQSRAIAYGALVGMVVTLRNTQREPLTLDLRLGALDAVTTDTSLALSVWPWPSHLAIRAIAVENDVLGPDEQTRLYLVLERRP